MMFLALMMLLQCDVGVRRAAPDLADRCFALAEIAHGHDDAGAPLGEHGGGLEAEACVGTGDYGHPAGLVGNIGGGPLRAHGFNILRA